MDDVGLFYLLTVGNEQEAANGEQADRLFLKNDMEGIMYNRILIPLDGSKEAEGVLPMIKDELAPDGEVILLQIIPPGKTQVIGGQTLLGSQREETERSRVEVYLRKMIRELNGDSENFRPIVGISESVSDGILLAARQNEVDLIAMYTHDRKGLSAILKKSIAKDVLKKASIEVKVFRPTELAIAV